MPTRALPALLLLLLLGGCDRRCTAHHPNGVLRSAGKQTLAGGAKTGEWTYWYRDGEIRERGRYRDGRRTGVWSQFHRNGQIHSRGERSWNGETGAAERGGEWVFWYQNGVVESRGRFERGLREGPWSFWTDTGEPRPAASGTYVAGERAREGPGR